MQARYYGLFERRLACKLSISHSAELSRFPDSKARAVLLLKLLLPSRSCSSSSALSVATERLRIQLVNQSYIQGPFLPALPGEYLLTSRE